MEIFFDPKTSNEIAAKKHKELKNREFNPPNVTDQ